MKARFEIVLSGVGGQGLILCGSILGEAAVIQQAMNATLTSSYGIETRGTFAKAEVVISREEISSPEIIEADVVLALAPVAYYKYIANIQKNTILIFDSGLIIEPENKDDRRYGYPINDLAKELGSEKAANIIALGIIIKKTRILKKESIQQVFKDKFESKEKLFNISLQAFEKGWEIG